MKSWTLGPSGAAVALPDSIAAHRDIGVREALLAVLHKLGEKFDAWTDPRGELESHLAGAQNAADLEQRLRSFRRGGFGF